MSTLEQQARSLVATGKDLLANLQARQALQMAEARMLN